MTHISERSDVVGRKVNRLKSADDGSLARVMDVR